MGCVMLVLLFTLEYAEAEWITLDFPKSSRTEAIGIDGGNIVGFYYGAEGERGFLYDLATDTWTSLSFPGADSTTPYAIDGKNIVGYYVVSGERHGFLYNMATNGWTTIGLSGETYAYGIDGNIVVGCYGSPGAYKGFLYDCVTTRWTTLEAPGAIQTYADGIDGGIVVGYGAVGVDDSWLYDIATATFTAFYGPTGGFAYPRDIDGKNVVGDYVVPGERHGFLYDGVSWTDLDFPGADATTPYGIDGGNIVGYYDASSRAHGFLYMATIDASVEIKPDTLNLGSKGRWITCYIGLPEGYDVEDIDIGSVALKKDEFEVGGEYGEFQTGKLMVKFPRKEVQDILEEGEVELTITGELIDGTPFEGTDTIRVIDKGGKEE